MLAEVHFPVPLPRGFDYIIPTEILSKIQPGHRVWAPFGRRGSQMGVVSRIHEGGEAPAGGWKSISSLVDEEPAIDEKDLVLVRWMARRYFCSFGEAVFCVIPVGKQRPPKKAPLSPPTSLETSVFVSPLTPTEGQKAALDLMVPAVEAGGFRSFLLFGAAAAGKTEVYLRCIDAALRLGRSAVYLVPEIGLTPQGESLLRNRFGSMVEAWHSGLSPGERWRVWRRVREGKCRVVLGPRSSLFLPLKNPGIFILDEEHDSSYKQDSTPHYHAREAALEKARLHGAAIIFGSATPSMEMFKRAKEGSVKWVDMPGRAYGGPPPTVRIVDMKSSGWYISDELIAALKDRLEKGEQSLLFLNRRGFATFVICRDCGWEARCPHCSVTLVFHKKSSWSGDLPGMEEAGDLRCHYCSFKRAAPRVCDQCEKPAVKMRGRGTQRVMEDIQLLFPKARLLRWDRDATGGKHGHRRAFEAVKSESVDIVVGTQMIIQGLDFPRVTLAGVLDADRSLRFPDFRAGEKTFQILTQASGRAGRADKPGEVFLQTRNPDHYAVQAAQKMNYKSFAEEELKFRREMGYPPFMRLVGILLRSRNAEKAEKAAEGLMKWLESLRLPPEISLLGPSPSFHKLRAGFTQWQAIVKSPPEFSEEIFSPLRNFQPPKSVSMIVDVDPENLI